MMVCFNLSFDKVTKSNFITLSKLFQAPRQVSRSSESTERVVDGLYEVPKPLLVSPKPCPTIDELMAKLIQAKPSGCKHPAATAALAVHFLVLTFLFTA